MTDVLIRGAPDDVIAALDSHASRLGLSRSEYVRPRSPVPSANWRSVSDLLIAATAELAGLTVLHCDKDSDLTPDHLELQRRKRASRLRPGFLGQRQKAGCDEGA